jgi:hypothetical protein
MKNSGHEQNKADVYDSRENWPPYTYRDYPEAAICETVNLNT